MNQRNGQTSNLIRTVAIITVICFIIIGLVIGALFGRTAMSTSNSPVRGLAVILGMGLGAITGAFIAMPISALLIGFAKIVAWYETVPPGCVRIIANDADTPDSEQSPPLPLRYAPPPTKKSAD